jgi:hypothetical protein
MGVDLKFRSLHEILAREGPLDVRRAESLINDLKIELLPCQSLLPGDAVPPEARLKFRNLLEYDALISIRTRNLEEFDRVMAQLKCCYFRDVELPPSDHMPLLLAIHLVRILALKKLVEFNIELQLTRDLLGPNEYLTYVADLHQSVIDNSFSMLFQLESAPPSPLFETFTADLLNGARRNHADSIERAYHCLTLNELGTILHFTSAGDVRQFVTNRPNWRLGQDDRVWFDTQPEAKLRTHDDMLARAVDLSIQISALA